MLTTLFRRVKKGSLFYALFLTALTTPVNSQAVEEIIIYATGDIMPSNKALPFIKKGGYSYPYGATRDILKSGDVVIANLETPLTDTGSRFEDKKFTFKAPVESAKALKEAGFTHLSLANNHMMDYGMEGLTSTLKALDEAGIEYAGAGITIENARRASITTVKGKRIAFLSYSNTYPAEFYATPESGGTAPGYRSYLTSDIKKAKKNADLLIVAFHWGAELMQHPKDYQKELAHLAVDHGADIILGHHPHVLQGVEHYGNGVIFYSLGNFAFGSYSGATNESIIAKITVQDTRISRVEAIPIDVNNFKVHFRPEPLRGDRGRDVIKHLSALSNPLGSNFTFEEDRGYCDSLNLSPQGASWPAE